MKESPDTCPMCNSQVNALHDSDGVLKGYKPAECRAYSAPRKETLAEHVDNFFAAKDRKHGDPRTPVAPLERSTRKNVEDAIDRLVGLQTHYLDSNGLRCAEVERRRLEVAAARQRLLDLYREEPRFTEAEWGALATLIRDGDRKQLIFDNQRRQLLSLSQKIESSLTATKKESV